MAATFSFFSAMRFEIRALKHTTAELREEVKRDKTHSYSDFCSF
jgi:hypothetical protein